MAINAANAIDEEVSNDSLSGPDRPKCAKREVRRGFLTGTSMPGRRSTPVRSIILLRRAVYPSEPVVELNGGDDRDQTRRNAPAGFHASISASLLISGDFKRRHSRHHPPRVRA